MSTSQTNSPNGFPHGRQFRAEMGRASCQRHAPSAAKLEPLARRLWFGSVVLALVVGCGGVTDDVAKFHVSGNVTHGGTSIKTGFIQFMPDATKGNNGPAGSASIVDGAFDTSESGQGTIGGPHTVVISGYDGVAQLEKELPFGMPLFPEYKTQADLSQDHQELDFDVPK